MAANPNRDQDEIVSDINMTPLIDIMLVLLIIFMVSSSAAIESGLNVNLPESNATAEAPAQSLIISMNQQGQMYVAGELVTMDQLKDKVAQGLANMKTSTVILEGDGQATLAAAFEVMNKAREAGAKDFSIAARPKD